MQTFRISKVQEQSYYAIRIFGVVHLIAAVGLVVLLDGPWNGLRGLSWMLILLFLSSSAYLVLRIFQARAGRIHGHYVLTRNTLAILLPGQPRMFVHRAACTGVLPGSWNLVMRNGRHLPLGSVSARPYFLELVSGVCRAWWPGFYGSTLWENSFSSFPEFGLNLRIDFRGRLDGSSPLFVYTRENSRDCRCRPILIMCGMFCVYFLALPVPSLYNAIVGEVTPGVLLRLTILSFLCMVGAVSTIKFGLHIHRQIRELGTLKDAYVISSRSLAALRAGDAPAFYRSKALIGYYPFTGQLEFQGGRSLLAAPYLYGDRYDGMLQHLFMRWRPGQQNLLLPRGAAYPQALLFLPLVPAFQFWTIDGSDFPYWTDAVGNVSCMLIIFFIAWFSGRKHAAVRIDVSLVPGVESGALSRVPTVRSQ